MANWLILFVAVIYVLTSLDLLIKSDYAMSLVFFAYAISNIGLYLVSRG